TGQLYLTDNQGKQQPKLAYPKNSYLGFQASSRGGNVLLSINANTPGETFVVLSQGLLKQLPAKTIGELHASSLIGLSHQLYFVDEGSVLAVNCPDAATECTLDRIDLGSGDQKTIIKTGLKQISKVFPQAYLLGFDRDKKIAYLRVDGANKLGRDNSAIYQIDTATQKVIGSSKLPSFLDYSVSLSPDYKQAAYQSIDTKNKASVVILNLADGKQQSISWTLSAMPSAPDTLKWSPDGQKILAQTIALNSADAKAAPVAVKTAYIDVTGNKVTPLQQIDDSRYGRLTYQTWLDDKTILYQSKKTSEAGNFAKASIQMLKVDIGTKKTSDFKGPTADLFRVFEVTKQ
ncbi:MAG: hypothetical protein JWO96_6, partial [Candidatus Saccharibacteria bacterium]|nr:hypothetical protein [Candidatus Saccharibacteria bacterium]